MKRNSSIIGIMLAIAMLIPNLIKANENRFKVNGSIEFVSDYIWRGMHQNSGFSVQPTLKLSYGNVSLGAWGSQSLTKIDGAQEVDINLTYTLKNFQLNICDYWWNGISSPYGDYHNDHHFEIAASYFISSKIPLTLSWATMFAGSDNNINNNRAFSTYISAKYDFYLPLEIVLTPSIGFTPWKGMYNINSAAITDISLKGAKSIKITDKFSLPIFVQFIASPNNDKTYLIGGFSFGF